MFSLVSSVSAAHAAATRDNAIKGRMRRNMGVPPAVWGVARTDRQLLRRAEVILPGAPMPESCAPQLGAPMGSGARMLALATLHAWVASGQPQALGVISSNMNRMPADSSPSRSKTLHTKWLVESATCAPKL